MKVYTPNTDIDNYNQNVRTPEGCLNLIIIMAIVVLVGTIIFVLHQHNVI